MWMQLFDLLTQWVIRHRLLLGMILLLVTGIAGHQALHVRTDFTVQELFLLRDPEIIFFEAFKKQFGTDDDQLFLLVEADDVFRRDVLLFIDQLTRRTQKLPVIARVQSLTTISDLGSTAEGLIDVRPLFETIPAQRSAIAALARRALHSSLIAGRLVARDRTLTTLVLKIQPHLQRGKETAAVVATVKKLVTGLSAPPRTRVYFTGVPCVRSDAAAMVRNDQLHFLPLGCTVTILLLLLLYRRFREVLVPMVSVTLAAGYTVALMAWLDIPIDILSNVVPLLVMVYGVADAVHVQGRIHEGLLQGAPREEALRQAMRHLGVACFITSLTTAIGFASLATGSMNILRRFGLVAASGVMIAYLVTIITVPLCTSSISRRSGAVVSRLQVLQRALAAIARLCLRRPKTLLIVGILAGVASLGLGSQVVVNNYLLGIYKQTHPTEQATRLAEQKLDGVVRLQVSLQGAPGSLKDPRVLRAMEQTERFLARQPGVRSTLSLATIIRELHRIATGRATIPDQREAVAQLLLLAEGEEALSSLVDDSFTHGRLLAGTTDVGAQRFIHLARQVETRLTPLFAPLGVQLHVTGTSLIAFRGINKLVLDMLTSLSLAFVVIVLVLAVVFRSLTIGLLSLIPNVLPLMAGLGFMALVGIRLEPATVVVFSIALGIAVDDTIHFFSRYHEEMRHGKHTVEDAVRITLCTAGRQMVFTSLILVAGFSTTLISNFPGTVRFGQLGCLVLLVALLTDLFVTPACLLVFKPWRKEEAPGKRS